MPLACWQPRVSKHSCTGCKNASRSVCDSQDAVVRTASECSEWPSANVNLCSQWLQIVHYTRGLTRGASAQQNERTDVLQSNGSIASDPTIAPEPAAPSYYLLSDALPPLLHQLLTCAHTACLLEARSTHVEFGQGAQVAHVHYTG